MALLSEPRIEAIQSVTAHKMTEPRVTRRVGPGAPGSFRRCFNTVLYYFNRAEEGDAGSGWDVAGWIKDSLGKAFTEDPVLCGRLRRAEVVSGGFEVVSNDSGARLVEARIGVGLKEFVGSEGREEAEGGLVYWKDIDEENPQFCPLFYIQVTNFQCGGYSIGISCSLLLADPPFIIGFLKKWAAIQCKLVSYMDPTTAAKKPIFYLHSIRTTTDPSSASPIDPSPCKKSAQTTIFKADRRTTDPKSLALLCADNVASNTELGAAKLSLLVREKSGEVKVEAVGRGFGSGRTPEDPDGMRGRVSWESFGAKDVAFRRGDSPAIVSHWIGSPDGFVMVTPAAGGEDEFGSYVFVTF